MPRLVLVLALAASACATAHQPPRPRYHHTALSPEAASIITRVLRALFLLV